MASHKDVKINGSRNNQDSEAGRSTTRQVVLGLLSNFSSIAPSMSLGFSAVALPVLQPYLSASQLSWFASVSSLSTPFGCFISGPIADRFGRKASLLMINVVCFIGWLAIAAACYVKGIHYGLLILGRITTGFSTGLSSSPATIYMAEVASPELRGVFTAWPSAFFALGVLLIYFMGFLLKDGLGMMSLIISLLPCVGAAFAIAFIPESPSWLVGKNRISEAKINMCKVRGTNIYDSQIQGEMEVLIKRKVVKSMEKKPLAVQIRRKVQFMLKPYPLKPLLLVLVFFFFLQASGLFVMVAYAIDIGNKAGVTIDPYVAIIIIGLVRFLASFLASGLNKRYGKRPLYIFSGSSMTFCLTGLVGYICCKDKGMVTAKYNYLPFLLLNLYFLTSCFGVLPIPFALAAELFPTKIRGLASGLTSGIGYLFSFVMVKLYPDMTECFGASGVFLFYGVVSLLGTIFAVFFLPETRGKTMSEIEEYFVPSSVDCEKSERRKSGDV